MKIIKYLINFFKMLKRRYIIAKAYPELKRVYLENQKEKNNLKKDIIDYLKKYYKIEAHSKFIPKDFKNKEQVRLAIISQFGIKMENLNLSYTDLFN